jgi:hypothetical protein
MWSKSLLLADSAPLLDSGAFRPTAPRPSRAGAPGRDSDESRPAPLHPCLPHFAPNSA